MDIKEPKKRVNNQIWLSPEQKTLVDAAAAKAGLNRHRFSVQAVMAEALRILKLFK